MAKEVNPKNPQLKKEEGECDGCGVELCSFTSLHVYRNPWNPDEVSIELYEDEDYPRFDARTFRLKDLGVNSVNELLSKLETNDEFLLSILRHFNAEAVKDNDFDCIDLIDNISVYSMCGDEQGEDKGILRVEKLEDGFRFGTIGSGCNITWVVRQHPKDPNKVVIFFEKDGNAFGFVIRDYDFFAVKRHIPNMCALYKYVVKDPWEATWFITWQELEFDNIEVINKSGYDGYDFKMCKYEESGKEEESEEERD
jgi:hypothetical protein